MKIYLTYILLLGCGVLASCGAQPAPGFFGAEREIVVEGEHRFTLFRKDDRFEIIRTGGYVTRGADQDAIRQRMREIVVERTGCRMIENEMIGDASEIRGRLKCR